MGDQASEKSFTLSLFMKLVKVITQEFDCNNTFALEVLF